MSLRTRERRRRRDAEVHLKLGCWAGVSRKSVVGRMVCCASGAEREPGQAFGAERKKMSGGGAGAERTLVWEDVIHYK